MNPNMSYTENRAIERNIRQENVELKEENAKLREQLAAAQSDAIARRNEAVQYLQRAEAAEAELKALDEQEPLGYWHQGDTYEESEFHLASESGDVSCASCVKLYREPVPPVDVQELQKRLSQAENQVTLLNDLNTRAAIHVTELERKLAAFQAADLAVWVALNAEGEAPFSEPTYEELNTLLAKAREEGRKEAVPEGVLADVAAERSRQHAKWDGVFDDQAYTPLDWHEMIADYNGWARRMACMRSFEKARTRYIQIAALAVAAVEAQDAMLAAAPTPGDKE